MDLVSRLSSKRELVSRAQWPWTRTGVLIALFVTMLTCAAAVPASAAARGVLRLGAVTIPANQRETKPLLVFGGPVTVAGISAAPIIAIGGPLRVEGQVSDDAVAILGNISLGPLSTANENVVALGGNILEAPGAHSSGNIIGEHIPWAGSNQKPAQGSADFLFARLRLAGFVMTALLLLGLAVWAVLPWPALVTTATARRFRLRSAFLGIAMLLWAPLIVAPLAVSLAGLPLAILLLLGFSGLWLIGVVSSAVRLGHRLLNLGGYPHSLLSASLAGFVCFGLLLMLPVAGAIALLLAGCVGLGGALIAMWDREMASDLATTQALSMISFSD